MTVTVLLFASYAEKLGTSRLELTLPEGATVAHIIRALQRLPGSSALPPSPLVAVNFAYAPASAVISPGDEVAIIPPVAGG